MTITLFISILTAASMITSVLTESVKKAYDNMHKTYSANAIALANAIVVGCGGTAVTYILLGIDWSPENILCMILMGVAVWMGAMVGYDKVMQLVQQITGVKNV